MSITIIIPHLNRKRLLEKCLNSILNQTIKSYNIILIDNGSNDGSKEFIRKNHPQIQIIENKENRGYAAAINQGIVLSPSEYILFLNNDIFLEKDCLENLLECIETDKNIFAVSSKLIQYHNPDKIDDAGDEYTLLGWTKRRGYGKSSKKYNKSEEVFSACAGAALYKRDLLEEIGDLDENFFAYLEDVDLSYRARINGYKCLYCSKALAYHVGSATSGSRYNKIKIKLAARNSTYLPYKNMPWPQLLVNFPFLVSGFFIKYIYFLKMGYGSVYLSGLKEGISNLNKIKKIEYHNVNFVNYIKIEYLLIKNTLKFLFL